MPKPAVLQLKRLLLTSGFEVYRSQDDGVTLAERVRENLILDSGVTATLSDAQELGIRVVLRAQATAFPGESPEQVEGRARELSKVEAFADYAEVSNEAVPIMDPGDRSRTLDTCHEVVLEKAVETEALLLEELRVALEATRLAGG